MDPEFIQILIKDCVASNIRPDIKGKIEHFPLKNFSKFKVSLRNYFATCRN